MFELALQEEQKEGAQKIAALESQLEQVQQQPKKKPKKAIISKKSTRTGRDHLCTTTKKAEFRALTAEESELQDMYDQVRHDADAKEEEKRSTSQFIELLEEEKDGIAKTDRRPSEQLYIPR